MCKWIGVKTNIQELPMAGNAVSQMRSVVNVKTVNTNISLKDIQAELSRAKLKKVWSEVLFGELESC